MSLRIIMATLAFTSFISSTLAQEVTIPDPGLNAAIRVALQKPVGPLTETDLLSLTNLIADNRGITSIAGLEAAGNLVAVSLQSNHLANLSIPGGLTNLTAVDLSFNPLTNCSFPDGLTNLNRLIIKSGQLSSFTLSSNLARRMFFLDLSFNTLVHCDLSGGMTSLNTLSLEANRLTNFTLPAGLNRLRNLALWQNRLSSFTLPADTTNLFSLLLNGNLLTNVILPPNLNQLNNLDLDFNLLQNLNLPAGLTQLQNLTLLANQLTGLTIPADMTNLRFLDVDANQLLSFTVPAGLTELRSLRLGANKLGSFTLPTGLTNLISLAISENQLTNLTLPSDLINVSQLDLGENPFTDFIFPAGLIKLSDVDLGLCRLTNLTLPPDMTNLGSIFLGGNPLTQLVLSEPQATNLAATVASLQAQGIPVFKYPLDIKLTKLSKTEGAFRFAITGPPGFYAVLSSTNLTSWSVLDVANNLQGSVFFLDAATNLPPQKMYHAQRLPGPPANMVFIPANTFLLGSTINEIGHQADEGPLTLVKISRGYWIGKYEVTQREYLAVTGENPSNFFGDLDRPVESVSFFAASNYCVLLTQQDMAAGRIPPGTHYRLPTEAEWECAARAGNTNRFYYGDDPSLTNLVNYAWFGAQHGIATHPVGLKLPNAWGLYDMEGNVWEWCQDWYGSYPGGTVADPQGPATHPIGFKVIRGGAWESSEFDCRSASRWFEGASPFINDFIIGFRVVLVTKL